MFFKVRSSKNASQLIKSLLNVEDYIQMKYNNEVGEAFGTLMKQSFNKPRMLVE